MSPAWEQAPPNFPKPNLTSATHHVMHQIMANLTNDLTASASHTIPARFLFTGNGTIMEPVQIVDHLAADQFGALPNEAGMSGSGSIAAPAETPILKLVHDYLLVILLISVMFSMGCGVTILEVRNILAIRIKFTEYSSFSP